MYHMKYGYGNLINDINAPRIKHRALTGMLRKKWSRNPNVLQRIVYNCDVSPYLGELPPQLRERVPREEIASVTANFREHLENFLIKNIFELRSMDEDKLYELPEIGGLFGTKCELFARGINVFGVNPWSGLLGFVCKLSFPEINAHYALKLYHKALPDFLLYSHGPWFEVGTALATNRAEPSDNVPMYMASLKYEKYMLSLWAGDKEDKVAQRNNMFEIFATSAAENESRNRRAGRRMDWGETYKTDYGSLSYLGRKAYRQMINMDETAVKKTFAVARNNFDKRDVARALEQAKLLAKYDENQALYQFLARVNQR